MYFCKPVNFYFFSYTINFNYMLINNVNIFKMSEQHCVAINAKNDYNILLVSNSRPKASTL